MRIQDCARRPLFGDLTLGRVQEMLKGLSDAAAAAQGNLILPHAPRNGSGRAAGLGPAADDAWLMRK